MKDVRAFGHIVDKKSRMVYIKHSTVNGEVANSSLSFIGEKND
jgi:hypothetical protein